jgi:uncharacterized DUF497 family protein
VRLFSDRRGAIYFPTRADRYGRIKPHQCVPEISAAWPQAARYASKLGLGLNAWTITLFSPWIRDAHPECARVLSGGDRSGSGVCPANSDVREFFATLCEDASEQFEIGLFRLESVMPTFDFDWLRPRILVNVPPLARGLLNLCFCGACTDKAAARGLDVQKIRQVVNEIVETEITDGARDEHAARVTADAELQAFITSFVQSSTEFVRIIAARLKSKARLSVNPGASYVSLIGAARDDALMTEFFNAADQLEIHPGNPNNKRYTQLAAGLEREISALIPLVRMPGSAGPRLEARVGGPEATARNAVELGATELSLYNIGLLGEHEIPDFIRAFRQTASAS